MQPRWNAGKKRSGGTGLLGVPSLQPDHGTGVLLSWLRSVPSLLEMERCNHATLQLVRCNPTGVYRTRTRPASTRRKSHSVKALLRDRDGSGRQTQRSRHPRTGPADARCRGSRRGRPWAAAGGRHRGGATAQRTEEGPRRRQEQTGGGASSRAADRRPRAEGRRGAANRGTSSRGDKGRHLAADRQTQTSGTGRQRSSTADRQTNSAGRQQQKTRQPPWRGGAWRTTGDGATAAQAWTTAAVQQDSGPVVGGAAGPVGGSRTTSCRGAKRDSRYL